MLIDEAFLEHYGTPRKSGRYPWGSGGEGDTMPRNGSFLDTVAELHKKGLTETQIAEGFGISTTQLRAYKSIDKNKKKQEDISQAQRLKEKGLSNTAIGQRMGINESSVRSLLAPGQKDKTDVLHSTANMLKDQVAEKGLVDIGKGVEMSPRLGVSKDKLNTAVAMLQDEGYKVHYVKIRQPGTGHQTVVKVLSKPGVTYSEVLKNQGDIKQIDGFSEDNGRTYSKIQPPLSIPSKRVGIRYAEQGGAEADGVIYVRPGVDDVSIGSNRYAQVRVAVDGTHYLKGMAMYKDDLPAGVDLVFNTNKSNTGNKLDAMKSIKDDPENPFGATIRQLPKLDANGRAIPNTVRSSMNIVNEEGDWSKWSIKLSSQFLAKQGPSLAKQQLDLTFDSKKEALDEILSLTNPTVKKKLLDSFADSADSAAVHLKAKAIPRTGNYVILPVKSMKENEIYAPKFRNGERVVLVRHPHAGIFEIPELTVNNRQPEAKKLLGAAEDAVGIHAKVAEKLSGADFDGDSVLVIPNNNRAVKFSDSLAGLKSFDSKTAYPAYDGMKTMGGGTWDAKAGKEVYPPGKGPSGRTKGIEMGFISNLITDMSVQGATPSELARAVRHSMVVIDAEKHVLNYRESARANGIPALRAKYQKSSRGGANTLLSRAGGDVRVDEIKPRSAAKGGPIDKATGKRVFEPTGATRTDATGKVIPKKTTMKKLALTDDANTLSSGTTIEKVYADHSNKLKALANHARKEMVNTKDTPISASAKKVYASEVASLNSKLNIALRNAPLERQALILTNAAVRAKRQANPNMDKADLKKLESQELTRARIRTGAQKQRIALTEREWQAIQAGAISTHRLSEILNNADLEQVKKLATPKATVLMTSSKTRRAQTMLNAGYTQAEVADALGVSLTTLKTSIGGEGA